MVSCLQENDVQIQIPVWDNFGFLVFNLAIMIDLSMRQYCAWWLLNFIVMLQITMIWMNVYCNSTCIEEENYTF